MGKIASVSIFVCFMFMYPLAHAQEAEDKDLAQSPVREEPPGEENGTPAQEEDNTTQEEADVKKDHGQDNGERQDGNEKPARETILYIDHLFGLQYGPLGVLYQVDPNFRRYLFPGSDNILLKEAFLAFGITGALTPAVAYYGPSITLAPLTILQVTIQFTHFIFGMTGKKYGLLDYNPENAPPELADSLGQFGNYDYAFRDEHGDKVGKVDANAWALFIKPTLMLQLGPVVFVDMANFMYIHPEDHKGLYYNDMVDIIQTPETWCIQNDTLLLYEIASLETKKYALLVGLANSMTFVVPTPGDPYLEQAYRWKIGPMVAWTITDKWGDYLVEKPTVLFQAHYVIKDPIDEDNKRIITAVLALAFSTNWDRKY